MGVTSGSKRAAVGLVLTGGLCAGLAAQMAQAGRRTIWDGVYAEAQATRGREVYTRTCARCHKPDLGGGYSGESALTGELFFGKWSGMTLSQLYDKTAQTMPKESGGLLNEREYVDVVAYILKVNQAPAGQSELTANRDALRQINITGPPKP